MTHPTTKEHKEPTDNYKALYEVYKEMYENRVRQSDAIHTIITLWTVYLQSDNKEELLASMKRVQAILQRPRI